MSLFKFLLLTAIASFSLMYSQPYTDIFQINYQASLNYYPTNSFENYKKTVINPYLKIPIKISLGTYFITGGSYEKIVFHLSEKNQNYNFHAISTFLGFQKSIKENRFSSLILFMPKIFSDNLAIYFKDIQWRFYSLCNYHKTSNLTFNFGLYLNTEYYGINFTPLLGIDWKIKKVLLFCILPQKFNIEYQLTSKLSAGFQIQTNKRSIRYNKMGTNYYLKEGDENFGTNLLGGYFCYYINNYAFTFEASYTNNDYFTLYNNDELIAHSIFTEAQNTILFNLKLNYRVYKG